MEYSFSLTEPPKNFFELHYTCSDVFNHLITKYLNGHDYIMLKCTSKAMANIMPYSWQVSEEIGNKVLNRFLIEKRSAFITGPGGCGKTHTIRRIMYHAERLNLKIALLSTTGISASYIEGITLHSFFGIGRRKNIDSFSTRPISNTVKNAIAKLDAFIVDEVSMCGTKVLTLIDYVCRECKQINKPMGGIPILFSGDFYQLPPVMDKLPFNDKLWKKLHLRMYKYEVSVRHKGDDRYFHMLNRIRIGEANSRDIEALLARNGLPVPLSDGIRPIYMFATNKDTNSKNQEEYNKINGVETLINAFDSVLIKVGKSWSNTADYTVNQARTETENQTQKVPEVLGLKVGAQYYITVNINQKKKLLNGTACIFLQMAPSGQAVVAYSGGIAALDMKPFTFLFGYGKYCLHRMQYPLKLGYAMTIHYSQGATLERAVIDTSGVFACAQVYVALSRVKSLDGVYLVGFEEKHIRVSKAVKEFYGDLTDEDLVPIKPYKVKENSLFAEILKEKLRESALLAEILKEKSKKKRTLKVVIIEDDKYANIKTYRVPDA